MEESELFKLENYLKSYLYNKKMRNSAKNTISTYSRILESFLEYYRGYYEEISLEKIDKAFIVAFLNTKALSSSSKNLYSTILKKLVLSHKFTNLEILWKNIMNCPITFKRI